MISTIGVGDNTVDTYVHCRKKYPGGNALNVAVLAGQYGAVSAYLGAVGGDENGQIIRNALQVEGIDYSRCRFIHDVPNAYAQVNVIDGERVFGGSSSGASAMLHLEQADLEYIQGFDVVHTSIYSYLDSQLGELRSASRVLSFDFSDHLDELERILNIFPMVDVAIFSVSNCSLSIKQLLDELSPEPSQIVIFTQGNLGSYVHHKEHLYFQESVKVDAVDSMGAGDAYIAAFLVQYYSKHHIEKAMQLAAEKAAQNCLHMGAFGRGFSY